MFLLDKPYLQKIKNIKAIKISEPAVINTPNLPLNVYFDEEIKSIVIESDYDIIFKSKGNIVIQAQEKQVFLGKEIHLNPGKNVIAYK